MERICLRRQAKGLHPKGYQCSHTNQMVAKCLVRKETVCLGSKCRVKKMVQCLEVCHKQVLRSRPIPPRPLAP